MGMPAPVSRYEVFKRDCRMLLRLMLSRWSTVGFDIYTVFVWLPIRRISRHSQFTHMIVSAAMGLTAYLKLTSKIFHSLPIPSCAQFSLNAAKRKMQLVSGGCTSIDIAIAVGNINS